MATTLEDILKPTQELDGVRYFDAESVLMLGAAVSDIGRDYEVFSPVDEYGISSTVKLGAAVERIFSGDWPAAEELQERIDRIEAELPGLIGATLGAFGRFSYRDPRVEASEHVFDPNGELTDIPEFIVGRFAGAHFSTLQKISMKLLVTEGFVGEIGAKLNGLELRYWNRRRVEGRGRGPYDLGFYLYFFLDTQGHLLAWKTGIDTRFERDGRYSLIGGRVKAHDSYPGQPSKTLLTRAKFFDHQTSDSFDLSK